MHLKTSKKFFSKQPVSFLLDLSGKFLSAVISAVTIFIATTSTAWAVQAHGGSEGLVSHQIGHTLFSIGTCYLLYRFYAAQKKGSGWAEFKAFLWLLILWNITTFTGHWLNESVYRGKFIQKNGHTIAFTAETLQDVIYYMTRLDHLILVPSFAFLLLALRKWRMQS